MNDLHILPGQPRDERLVEHVRPGVPVLWGALDPENRAAAIERYRIYGAQACDVGELDGAGAQRGGDTPVGEGHGTGAGTGGGKSEVEMTAFIDLKSWPEQQKRAHAAINSVVIQEAANG